MQIESVGPIERAYWQKHKERQRRMAESAALLVAAKVEQEKPPAPIACPVVPVPRDVEPETATRPPCWFRIIDDVACEPISVSLIQRAVSAFYGISHLDIISDRKTVPLVLHRQIAMFLCRTLTLRSFADIGRRFGGRDHATILHGVRKIGQLIECGDAVKSDVEALTKILTKGVTTDVEAYLSSLPRDKSRGGKAKATQPSKDRVAAQAG